MSEYKYTGIFFDNSLDNILSGRAQLDMLQRNVLETSVPRPHVTFVFNPDEYDILRPFFGTKLTFTVNGYACDGRNEALRVVLNPLPNDTAEADNNVKRQAIIDTIPEGKLLHITLSLSDDGARARDSEKLEFKDIEPFEITGKYGAVYEGSGTVNTDPYDPSLCETKLVVPFYAIKKKKSDPDDLSVCTESVPLALNNDWVESHPNTRYLARYIAELFGDSENNKDGVVSRYFLQDDAYISKLGFRRGTRIQYHFKHDKKQYDVDLLLTDIQIFRFATDVNLFVMSFSYADGQPVDLIVDAAAKLSYIFNEQNDRDSSFSLGNGARILKERNKLISRLVGQPVEQFFSCRNGKCNLFNRLVISKEQLSDLRWQCSASDSASEHQGTASQSNDITMAGRDVRMYLGKLGLCMARGIGSDAIIEDTPDASSVHQWFYTSTGVTSLTCNPDSQYSCIVHQKNIRNYYFTVFILALHERECYLKYSLDAVSARSKPKKLIALSDKLNKFRSWTSYITVSAEENYQTFYEQLYDKFRLEKYESEISSIIEEASDHRHAKSDRRRDGFLGAIAILAILSALTDGIAFVDTLTANIGTMDWSSLSSILTSFISTGHLGHAIVYLLVFITILFGLIIRKNRGDR